MSNEHQFDILVVGGGPAGIASGVCAAESGLRVGIVDDNPAPGGQIWRGDRTQLRSASAAKWLRRLRESSIHFIYGARVIGQPDTQVLLAETFADQHWITYRKLILATGARERFLPFPGWTLPNVMGVGGLRALVKSGMPIEGKRVVVAGSGPLLLAVAAYLKKQRARVSLIAEQASWNQLVPFGAALWQYPGKLVQALDLKRGLAGVRFIANCWPVNVQQNDKLLNVTLQNAKEKWTEPCDYLACGFGLVPNLELASLLGCHIDKGTVTVDDWQESSAAGIYCAGELTGIGGVEHSLVEGQIAGYSAAERNELARHHFSERRKLKNFAKQLNRYFALRDELRSLVQPETIVCRCEDVKLKALKHCRSWREAKLQTRCGMGPCQGRICGAATEFLLGWGMDSVRPPLFPARLSSLAGVS
jgi:NADPH-dependent 2,4-dienoyl-CoA reductase/sulfur reductase-like enzyme